MRSTLSSSPAPAKRATSTLMPVNSDDDEDDDDDEDLPRDADRRVAGEADEVADHDVVDDALHPADDVRAASSATRASTRRGERALDDRAIEGFREIGEWRGSVSVAATPEVDVAMSVKGGYRASLA